MGELDTLLNVALQSRNRSLQKLLLLLCDVAKNVDGLLSAVGLRICQYGSVEVWTGDRMECCATYAKLDGNGEEVDTGLLGNLLAAGNAGEVDVARLNKTLLALKGLEDLLGESITRQSLTFGLSSVPFLTCSQRRPWREWQNQRRPWP